jgi:hypothetical protein
LNLQVCECRNLYSNMYDEFIDVVLNKQHRHLKSVAFFWLSSQRSDKEKYHLGIWNGTIDKDGRNSCWMRCEGHQALRKLFLSIADDCLQRRTSFVNEKTLMRRWTLTIFHWIIVVV